MREQIKIEGLDINVNRTITGFSIDNPRAVERTDTGIKWGGRVVLEGANGSQIWNSELDNAIRSNSTTLFTELNDAAQAKHTKNYGDLTVIESQTLQGEVMANKMIADINSANTGISIANVTVLVTSIVEALA